MTERDLIQERQGAVTVIAAFHEIEDHPGDFPNIRAFYPQSFEDAWEIAAKDAIRKAFKSVIIMRLKPVPGSDVPRQIEIRALHAIRQDGEDRQYKPLNIIRENQKDLAALIRDLQAEAGSYTRKVENVLAEVAEAIGGN
jgi:hypothetical protein